MKRNLQILAAHRRGSGRGTGTASSKRESLTKSVLFFGITALTIAPDAVLAATRMRVEFSAGTMYVDRGFNVYEVTNSYAVSGAVEFSYTPDQINELKPEGGYVNTYSQRILIVPTFAEVVLSSGGGDTYKEPIGVMLSGTQGQLDVHIGSIDSYNGVGSVLIKSNEWSLSRQYAANQISPFISYVQAVPGWAYFLGASCWLCDGQAPLTASFKVLSDDVPHS